MIVYEDQCYDCELRRCLSCPYNNPVAIYTCDICESTASYTYDGKDYCEDCLYKMWLDNFCPYDEITDENQEEVDMLFYEFKTIDCELDIDR